MTSLFSTIIVLAISTPFFFEAIVRYVLRDRIKRYPEFQIAYERFRKYFPYLAIVTLLLLFDIFESSVIDMPLWRAMGIDFTPSIHALEGDIVERFQASLRNPILDNYFFFMYVVMYVFTFYFSMFYYFYKDREDVVKNLATGYIVIWAVAIPFFLFFPVNEVWTTNSAYLQYNLDNAIPLYGYGSTSGVLYDNSPTSSEAAYLFSSINNCFPSLHTAISLLVPLVMFKKREVRFGLLTLWISVSIIISTMYLGVHWLTDVIAGIVLAFFALYIASNITYEASYPIRIKNVRWKGRPIKPLFRR